MPEKYALTVHLRCSRPRCRSCLERTGAVRVDMRCDGDHRILDAVKAGRDDMLRYAVYRGWWVHRQTDVVYCSRECAQTYGVGLTSQDWEAKAFRGRRK